MTKKQRGTLIRIIVAAALMALLALLPLHGWPRFVLFLAPYLIIGHDILRKAWKGIRNRQPFDECFLMAVATLGAIALGEYVEGVAVMLFYQIGELFQSVAVGRSRRSIAALMDIRPDSATLEGEDGSLSEVDPDEVEVGAVIVVQPGQKVPIDGVVIEGRSSLDTAALTGESVPRDVGEGEEIISGCVNLSGVLRIRTTKPFGESTVSKILDLVENAGSQKSRSENFISKFARYYTPAVVYGAIALALLPPALRLVMKLPPMWGEWISRALTFLVISCPCALVISIPLTFFAGIGGASSAGILVKGSNYLEALSKTRTVVMDKTGTLTQGVFEVEGVHHPSVEPRRILEYAALAECHSSHPISLSLRRAWGGTADPSRVRDVQEISGEGVIAQVDGVSVAAGNHRLMEYLGLEFVECHHPGTVVHVALDGVYAGHILITDRVKPNAQAAVAALKAAGVRSTVMLTGDRQNAAEETARMLGVDRVESELMPADKVSRVEALLSGQGANEKLAFVGDGINDAPVLRRADIGVAMGALGSDAAIEAADIVLMDDDPMKLAKAIRIARRCMRIVYENIGFALGVKLVCLALGALGIANMWAAVFSDVGVMVLAVLNAIRALNVKKL